MLRTTFLSFLLAGLLAAHTSSAQTKPTAKPAASKSRTTTPSRPRPAQATTPPANRATTDGQGEYVAPGMTGAPDDKVTTDYNNQPLKKPATGTSTMSSQPKAEPTPKKTN